MSYSHIGIDFQIGMINFVWHNIVLHRILCNNIATTKYQIAHILKMTHLKPGNSLWAKHPRSNHSFAHEYIIIHIYPGP